MSKSLFPQSSDFLNLLNELDSSVTTEEIEKKITLQASKIFHAKWGGIKYYFGDQFVQGFSNLPERYSVTPRKRGYTYRTFEQRKIFALTHEQLKKVHPETADVIRLVVIAPIFNSKETIASLSFVATKDIAPTSQVFDSLKTFGAFTGSVLKTAHHLEAERQAVHNRDKFISFAAHELKNPLQALSSYNSILTRSVDKGSKIKREWLLKMQGEVSRMQLLIDELLNVEHVQSGELSYNRKPFSLITLLTQVGDSFRVRMPHRKVKMRFNFNKQNDVLLGDETKLSQVFLNLLNNADKFSPQEEPIYLKVSENGSYFEISIEDKGIGIPPEEIDHIFNEFYRGTNAGRKKGIGVGLYLVKSIIERHNGKIEVESQLGKGSTFKLYLPKQS